MIFGEQITTTRIKHRKILTNQDDGEWSYYQVQMLVDRIKAEYLLHFPGPEIPDDAITFTSDGSSLVASFTVEETR